MWNKINSFMNYLRILLALFMKLIQILSDFLGRNILYPQRFFYLIKC